jgi:hypothetical protein
MDWLEFGPIPWRIEVRPLAGGHFERAHDTMARIDKAKGMWLRFGRRDLSGARFKPFKPMSNRSNQLASPSIQMIPLFLRPAVVPGGGNVTSRRRTCAFLRAVWAVCPGAGPQIPSDDGAVPEAARLPATSEDSPPSKIALRVG